MFEEERRGNAKQGYIVTYKEPTLHNNFTYCNETIEDYNETTEEPYNRTILVVCGNNPYYDIEWGRLELDPKRFAIVKIPKSEFNESWLEPEYDFTNPIKELNETCYDECIEKTKDETKCTETCEYETGEYEILTQRKYRLPLEEFMEETELTDLKNIEYNSKVDWSIEKIVTDVSDKIELTNYENNNHSEISLHGSSGVFNICVTNASEECDYTSLNTWETGEEGDILAGGPCIANITENFTDTTVVTIEGWTTNASSYIKIMTDTGSPNEYGYTPRHDGKWDDGGYKLVTGSQYPGPLELNEQHVRVEGLQVEQTTAYNDGANGIEISASGGEIRISYCVIKYTGDATAGDGIAGISLSSANDNTIYKIWNNIVYDFKSGIKQVEVDPGSNFLIYNNIVVDPGYRGIYFGGYPASAATVRLKNNLVQGSNTNYYISLGSNVVKEYVDNLAEDTTSPNNEHDSKTVIFVDEANNDFHLASTDTNATDQGTDLSSDGNLSFTEYSGGYLYIYFW